MYNEEENVAPFFASTTKVLNKLNHSSSRNHYKFNIIFVDDGCRDKSCDEVEKLIATPNGKKFGISLIRLARNFGKEIATSAGIHEAHELGSDAAMIMDSDLQHPPELIPEFISRWEAGADVVIGVTDDTGHNNFFKKLGSDSYYRIMSRISSIEMIPHSTDFRIIDQQVIDAFTRFTERERITRGLIDWLGFDREVLYFTPNEREHGVPTYTYVKLFRLAMSSFTSHSLLPLRIAGYLGLAFMISFGLLGIVTYSEMYIFRDPMDWAISGSALLGILMLFTIGIVLGCMGLVALYVETIHGEVVNRPLYVRRKDRRLDYQLSHSKQSAQESVS